MPDDSAAVPAMVCHYAAYMRAWLHVTPETSVHGNWAELRLNFGNKLFVAVFGCRKKNWSLRHIEIRRGERTATFTRGELAKAMAALLGHEPLAPTPQAINATSGPRTDTTLRERVPRWSAYEPGWPGVCRVSEPHTAAVMVRELGRQLAALRHAAGLTQHQLARLTRFSRSTVSLAEIGREPPARQFWEACDKALDTGGALTAGFDQITAVREAQQQATARAAQQAREAQALAALTAAQHQGDIATRVTTIQLCPQCQHPVTVLTTLIPSPPSPSHPA